MFVHSLASSEVFEISIILLHMWMIQILAPEFLFTMLPLSFYQKLPFSFKLYQGHSEGEIVNKEAFHI